MKKFLYETAEDILNKYKDDINSYCLIFPNKRTNFFFRKYYSNIYNAAHKPPKLVEINRFVSDLTKLKDIDDLSVIFKLYVIFRDFFPNYNFDSFYKLGQIILSDFNEIDSWLTDAEQIYKNIKDLKEIDERFDWLTEEQKEVLKYFWSTYSDNEKSKEKKLFLELWNKLPELYTKLRNELLQDRYAYNGLRYRYLNELLEKDLINFESYKKYIFIGFNALNNAELALFTYLKKIQKADFYWDTDVYYHHDFKQEAGDFLRKNFKTLSVNADYVPDNISSDKKIQITGVSLQVGQAKILPELLSDIDQNELNNDTAIILADEQLLFPVLSSLPENIEKVNVTMGYPMKMTSVFKFIQLFAELHIYASKKASGAFYAVHVLKILSHPFLQKRSKAIVDDLKETIKKHNLYYVSASFFADKTDPFLRKVFTKLPVKDNSEYFLETVLDLLFIIFDKRKDEDGNTVKTVHNEYIQKAYVKTKRLKQVMLENPVELSLKLSAEILIQILRSELISFEGDAVEGLQLMGLMESRNLDFKNIILLGFNEGTIPKVSKKASFLSQSIRFAYDLPLMKHQDSVYAYFFYRLLQRSENVKLIYNNVIDESNSGEISRFGLQLLFESGKDIKRINYSDKLTPVEHNEIRIKKDSRILQILDEFTNDSYRSFSPAAINTYLNCGLKFYLNYIAKIRKDEELEDQFSAAVFGNIIHKVLETIYSDLKLHPVIQSHMIKEKNRIIDNYYETTVKKLRHTDYLPDGGDEILKEVVKKYISYVLTKDSMRAPFECIQIEEKEKNKAYTNILINGEIKRIKLNGIIDRVDKKDGIYILIDYKTGAKKNDYSSVESLFKRSNEDRSSHILQLLFYSYIFKNQVEYKDAKIRPCVYYIRFMNRIDEREQIVLEKTKDGPVLLDEHLIEDLLKDFEIELQKLLLEIYSPDMDFMQTEFEKNCEYCEFKTMCGR